MAFSSRQDGLLLRMDWAGPAVCLHIERFGPDKPWTLWLPGMWRQGDPLSAYLFIIAEEVLSQNITQMVSRGLITPLSVQPGPGLPFICFFRTIFDFSCVHPYKGSSTSSYEVSDPGSISILPRATYFLVVCSLVVRIKSATGMSESKFSTTYLGVPLFQGAPKRIFYLCWTQLERDSVVGRVSDYPSQGGWFL